MMTLANEDIVTVTQIPVISSTNGTMEINDTGRIKELLAILLGWNNIILKTFGVCITLNPPNTYWGCHTTA